MRGGGAAGVEDVKEADLSKVKAPKTATEFELLWRSLKTKQGKVAYLTKKVGTPKKYRLSKLYSSGFQDAVVFEGILAALDSTNAECKEVVEELAKVPNVDMLCMMVEKGTVDRVVEKAYGGGEVPDAVKRSLK